MNIVTIQNKKDEKFLRKKTRNFDFAKYTKKEIRELIKTMRVAMREANGIGLSANQIGLDIKVFVAQVPDDQGRQKFYAIFNPELTKLSAEKNNMEEGCLSVPEKFGMVERPDQTTLEGMDQNGKKIKIKAWGLLARVFQHEVDHLNGALFIDKAKSVQTIPAEPKN